MSKGKNVNRLKAAFFAKHAIQLVGWRDAGPGNIFRMGFDAGMGTQEQGEDGTGQLLAAVDALLSDAEEWRSAVICSDSVTEALEELGGKKGTAIVTDERIMELAIARRGDRTVRIFAAPIDILVYTDILGTIEQRHGVAGMKGNEMNAFQIYDAAFDSANDDTTATAAYVQAYAEGAFDLFVSNEVAELVAMKKREWDAGELGSGRDDFWHGVEAPLSEIEMSLIDFLDADPEGTGHSFFAPFRRECAPTMENVEWMIVAALDTRAEDRTERGRPTGFALTAARYLRRFRSDDDFRRAATLAALERAVQVKEEYESLG